MDKFDDGALALFTDRDGKLASGPSIQEIAAFGRKCYAEGRAESKERMEAMEKALLSIVNQDYRGHPCSCAAIARYALAALPKEKS